LKIIIVSRRTKNGLRYYSYNGGALSFIHVFCCLNALCSFGYESIDECLSESEKALVPDPPPNTKIAAVYDINV